MKIFYLKQFNKIFRTATFIICLLTSAVSLNAQTDLTIRLNNLVDSIYVSSGVPGIAVDIQAPGISYNYIVGKADLATGTDRKMNDKIRIGSITKTFVATVILQLVEEGKLGLDDKLFKFYPDYPNSENITIRQILDMTSGIPDYIEDPSVLKSFFTDRLDKYTPLGLYDITKSMTPYFSPGTGWHYSNGNYNILGMMIEKITGNKIEDEINRRIITPLGLSNTSFPVLPEMPGPFSHGYLSDTVTKKLTDVTVMDPSITWAAGCMISNIEDLKIYVQALAKGSLLTPSIQEQRLKWVETGGVSYARYGLGIFDVGGFIGHNGGITGYNTTMGYDPSLDAIAITSVNEYGFTGGISDQVFTAVLKTVFPDKNLFQNK